MREAHPKLPQLQLWLEARFTKYTRELEQVWSHLRLLVTSQDTYLSVLRWTFGEESHVSMLLSQISLLKQLQQCQLECTSTPPPLEQSQQYQPECKSTLPPLEESQQCQLECKSTRLPLQQMDVSETTISLQQQQEILASTQKQVPQCTAGRAWMANCKYKIEGSFRSVYGPTTAITPRNSPRSDTRLVKQLRAEKRRTWIRQHWTTPNARKWIERQNFNILEALSPVSRLIMSFEKARPIINGRFVDRMKNKIRGSGPSWKTRSIMPRDIKGIKADETASKFETADLEQLRLTFGAEGILESV